MLAGISLVHFINESEFRVTPDKVSPPGKSGKRGVIPDFYLQLTSIEETKNSDAHLLFEIDMATRDNARFEREKLSAYAEYIGSQPFRERFGSKHGTWLIITTGKRRLSNLSRLIEKLPDSKRQYFYLSTFDLVAKGNPLTSKTWTWPGASTPVALINKEENREPIENLVYAAS